MIGRLSLPLLLLCPAGWADKVTYDDHVLPVFQQACLNCHNPDKTKGGLDLSSYGATLKGGSGGKIVEPGDAGSTLIAVVRHAAEPKMPPEGDPLAKQQIDLLVRWIEGGLLENATATAKRPPKAKFAASVAANPTVKPDGPPPMPRHLRLEPVVVTERGSAVQALAASPWAPLVAVSGQRQVLLHHAETLELAGILPFPEGDPLSLAFSPDGRYLIVGGGVPGKSGVTVTFDVTDGSRLLVAGREFDSILAADIRPGYDLVATGGPSRLLKLWNIDSGDPFKSIKKHTDWITALDISPDGVLLVSGDRNGGVWVWESATGSEFHTLRGHQAAITGIEFRADSDILATASEDGTLRFWEMNGGSEVRKIDAHPGGVTAFSFARDGASLSAGRDRNIRLWNADFSPRRNLAEALPELPTAVALDPEGRRAFVGDVRGIVSVFDTADGRPLGELPSNPPPIARRLAEIAARISAEESATPGDPAALAALRAAHRRWSAALIHTRHLDARKRADEELRKLEALQQAFTAAAARVTEQADLLNRKRAGRDALAAPGPDPAWSAATCAEWTATLAAADAAIERELANLRDAEARLNAIRQSLDPQARDGWKWHAEAVSLHQAYLEPVPSALL